MNSLLRLSRPAMLGLAEGLDSGRVPISFTLTSLQHYVPKELSKAIQKELRAMAKSGMTGPHIATTLSLLADERAVAQAIADRVELVWSGTEVMAGGSRDTAVVVQELFREARNAVLIASYSMDSGDKAEALFGALAKRMDEDSTLRVRLFVNVKREYNDETAEAILLRDFADHFRDEIWPGKRLPEVYFDPRSLSTEFKERACLHAKCVVIDDDRALITSANFSEAAHERNIEAGTVISDRLLAKALKAQFETLVDHGALKRVPGI